MEDLVHQLRDSCTHPMCRVLRNLLPTIWLWDATHPEEALFVPVSVVSLSKKKRPVFEWVVRPFDAALLEALGSLPRERRSVPPDLAARFCPELMTRYGVTSLNKKLDSSPLRHRSREHWRTQAEELFGDLGLPVPSEVDETLRHWEGLWRQQAFARRWKESPALGKQLKIDAFIVKANKQVAAGVVDVPGAASCVLSPPNKRKRWAIGFVKKQCTRVIIFAAEGP